MEIIHWSTYSHYSQFLQLRFHEKSDLSELAFYGALSPREPHLSQEGGNHPFQTNLKLSCHLPSSGRRYWRCTRDAASLQGHCRTLAALINENLVCHKIPERNNLREPKVFLERGHLPPLFQRTRLCIPSSIWGSSRLPVTPAQGPRHHPLAPAGAHIQTTQ